MRTLLRRSILQLISDADETKLWKNIKSPIIKKYMQLIKKN